MTCADMHSEGYVYNPPSENKGLFLRVSTGCSHNACTFCGMYRHVHFRVRPIEELLPTIMEAKENSPNLRRAFLGDGNALAAPTADLIPLLQRLKTFFPSLLTISCAARANDLLEKSPQELALLRANGLSLIYLGIESGDDKVLKRINKGVTADETIRAAKAADAANIDLSTMIILGLGGKELTEGHALHTAELLSEISPAMLGIMTLLPRAGTPLEQQIAAGRFQRLTRQETLQELLALLSGLQLKRPSLLRASHLYNYIDLAGTVPEDKEALLEQVRQSLVANQNDEKELAYKNYGIF